MNININELPEMTGKMGSQEMREARLIRTMVCGAVNSYFEMAAARIPADKMGIFQARANGMAEKLLAHTDAKWWMEMQTKIEQEYNNKYDPTCWLKFA